MKRKLTAFFTVSLLALGSLNTYVYSNDYVKETKEQQYITCVEQYKNLIPGKDYLEGNIIVGFSEGITREAAKLFIEQYDKNKKLEIIRYWNDFDETGWTTVKVPKGKEIEYACLLDSLNYDKTIIKFATPNITVSSVPIIIIKEKVMNEINK